MPEAFNIVQYLLHQYIYYIMNLNHDVKCPQYIQHELKLS